MIFSENRLPLFRIMLWRSISVLSLGEPEAHVHVAVHRGRGGVMVFCILGFAGAAMDLAETEMAVGDQRAHAVALRQCQRVAVVADAALVVETIGIGRDIAEQMVSMGGETRLARRRFDGALRKDARFVELAEPQQSAADGMIGPAAMADDALARLPLEQRLGFLDAVRRVGRIADFRHRPSR
jgi:hypothetical protein